MGVGDWEELVAWLGKEEAAARPGWWGGISHMSRHPGCQLSRLKVPGGVKQQERLAGTPQDSQSLRLLRDPLGTSELVPG